MTFRTLLPLGLLALAAAASGCGSSSSAATPAATAAAAAPPAAAAPAGGPISVDLTEWAIKPSSATARAGKVTFKVANTGQTVHELVVLKTKKPAGKLGSGSRIPEPGNVGETGDLEAGASKTISLELKPGHYALVCNLPGHYMSGMHTDFTVK